MLQADCCTNLTRLAFGPCGSLGVGAVESVVKCLVEGHFPKLKELVCDAQLHKAVEGGKGKGHLSQVKLDTGDIYEEWDEEDDDFGGY